MTTPTQLRPGNIDDIVTSIRTAIQHVLDAEYLTLADTGADDLRRKALTTARTYLESAEFDLNTAIITLVKLTQENTK